MYLAHEMLGDGYDVIAPSRFGYLRPKDASHTAQADAHAALLDKLGVEDGIIMGVSAGAPSAIEFALRYPERTRALARPDLDGIDAPTLLISAKDDLYHTRPGARFAAEHKLCA